MEENDPRKLLLQIATILEELDIPYLITGGMAVFIWGRPRFTADIDLVVEIPMDKADRLEQALRRLSEKGYIDHDTIEDAVRRQGEFNFIDGSTGMKVDFWVSTKDAFDTARMKRRTPKNILGHDIFFSTPEDLILSKARWYVETRSSRHIEDIQSIIRQSGQILDHDYLRAWIEKLGLHDLLAGVGIVFDS